MIRTFYLLLALLFCSGTTSASTGTEQDHQALREVLTGLEQAINTEKYGDLARYFHKEMRVTTINQEILSSPGEIAAYFDKWFGPKGYLKKLHITLTADDLTEFYANGRMGVVRGKGVEDYILSDTRTYRMETRWTATVIKEENQGWRILSLHIGTNFLNNPILGEAEGNLIKSAVGGAAVGTLLGAAIMWLFKRRRAAFSKSNS